MPIYFLTFHTKPTLANEQVNKIEGAYINCWIDADDIETAEKTAAQKIQDSNWEILNTEDGYEITREDYPSRNKGLECSAVVGIPPFASQPPTNPARRC